MTDRPYLLVGLAVVVSLVLAVAGVVVWSPKTNRATTAELGALRDELSNLHTATTDQLGIYAGRVSDLEMEVGRLDYDLAEFKKHTHGRPRSEAPEAPRPVPAFPRGRMFGQ